MGKIDIIAHINNTEIHGKSGVEPLSGAIVDNGNSGSSKTIDWTAGAQQMITTTDDCTLTFTAPASPRPLKLLILHENSTSSYAYTFPSDVKFPEGYTFVATPATAYALDVMTFWYLGDIVYTETGIRYYAMGNNNAGG